VGQILLTVKVMILAAHRKHIMSSCSSWKHDVGVASEMLDCLSYRNTHFSPKLRGKTKQEIAFS